MKGKHLISFFFLALTHLVQAEPNWLDGSPVYYSTTATNGLEFGVVFESVREKKTSINNQMVVVFRLSESCVLDGRHPDYIIVYEPKPEYLARLTLFDSEKHEVKKTVLGATYDLKPFKSWDYKYMKPYSNTKKGPPYPIFAHDSWSRDFIRLPEVSKLFEVTKPGKYVLMMELQVFQTKGTNNKYAVKFPPVEIPLELEP